MQLSTRQLSTRRLSTRTLLPLGAALVAGGLVASCGDDGSDGPRTEPFALTFVATDGTAPVGCSSSVTGVGPNGADALGVSDLRFYVSNVRLLDRAGAELPMTLDVNELQYESTAGSVALVDLTGNAEGTCADTALSFPEGTARTHDAITGMVTGDVASVTFDVGLPQAVMKDVIATNSAEGAPSPLAEMYWSWASGYRHFVFNFTVTDGDGHRGEGYLHIGSRDCGGDGARALTDRDACGFANTPAVRLDDLDPSRDTVEVDLRALVAGLDLVAPVLDSEPPFAVIGEGPGAACHSAPVQADCPTVFANMGLDMATGRADASSNRVFSKR